MKNDKAKHAVYLIVGYVIFIAVKGNVLLVSEPMCKYHHSEGWEKISEKAMEVSKDVKILHSPCRHTMGGGRYDKGKQA